MTSIIHNSLGAFDDGQQSMSADDVLMHLPPGYVFKPKDEELIQYYLRRKITSSSLPHNIIREVQLYNYHPRDICQNHELIDQENPWYYFFTLTEKKFTNGIRPNRTTGGNGFWKATGGDVKITINRHEIGLKKTLVYYEGKTKDHSAVKTNWIMHEYRIDPKTSQVGSSTNLDNTMVDYSWVLCRIYHRQTSKSKDNDGSGPRLTHENHQSDHERNLSATRHDDRGEELVVPYVTTPPVAEHITDTHEYQQPSRPALVRFGNQLNSSAAEDYNQQVPLGDEEFPLPECFPGDYLEDDGHLESLLSENIRQNPEAFLDFGYWGPI